MEQEQTRYKEQQRIQTESQSKKHSETTTANFCPKCGALNENGAMFCEECGVALGSETCTRCGADILPGADVCEQCGLFLKKDRCGFCGEGMSEDDAFCPECGSPRAGINCPQCSTHNHSAFCIKCYTPLTEIARLELQKAHQEPAFQQVLSISAEINELEKQLKEIESEVYEDVEPEEKISQPETPKTAKQLERERRNEELKQIYLQLSQNGSTVSPPTESPVEAPKEVIQPKRKPLEKRQSKENIEAIVKQKRLEMQQLLDSMKPDDATSPQMVRNYYTARKPPVSDSVWLCNFNSCYHPNPTHCGKPFLGGKWVVVYEKIDWETHYGTM